MKDLSKLLACVLAMACVLASGFTFAETGVTQDTIKVGVISDLTGPAAIGDPVQPDQRGPSDGLRDVVVLEDEQARLPAAEDGEQQLRHAGRLDLPTQREVVLGLFADRAHPLLRLVALAVRLLVALGGHALAAADQRLLPDIHPPGRDSQSQLP